MEKLFDYFQLKFDGCTNVQNIVKGKFYRITFITSRLVRMEYDPSGNFEDRATQTVWNRNFSEAVFHTIDKGDELCLYNDYLELHYTKKEFSANSLWIDIKGAYSNHDGTWHFGELPKDLKGTCRTLDKANGAVELESGLCARNGYSILDDSNSLIVKTDGTIEPRKNNIVDIYYFGYGHDYQGCIRDFYKLTGEPPMLPRYAYGNWWSRYYSYTQEEYQNLIEKFTENNLPFSVAVLDMDWHITKVPEKYGRGWTGYTWNKELFPEPEKFLKWLHEKNLKVSLNIHPADGVKAFEEMYIPMAKKLGVNYLKEEPIPFDISDTDFLNVYFEYLHHPLEKQGVDFWWIDWQSGGVSKVKGLDPLWMLNHYHTLDNARDGKRPMIFSRYSGPGSHRYPVGFSGDTHITWESLNFQPYFTANASNIGYLFWSHDIGGHMLGIHDDELMVRWIQFGVFSPINRLHSSNSLFAGKEPWNYGIEAEKAMGKMLRLRHKLIPYLYSMNYQANKNYIPLMRPMYYTHPENEESYTVPNQYWFGTELIVHPITSPNNDETLTGSVKAWLPEGVWVDFFNGMVYSGNREICLNRTLDTVPVLAKAGAIIPLADIKENCNSVENPKSLEIICIPGKNGEFELYEDEGDNQNYKNGLYAITKINTNWEQKAEITIKPEGELSVLPKKRNYTLLLRGCKDVEQSKIQVQLSSSFSENKNVTFEKRYDQENHTLIISIENVSREMKCQIEICETELLYRNEDFKEKIFEFLLKAQINNQIKERIYSIIQNCESKSAMISGIMTQNCSDALKSVLLELLTA